ncbi:MAG: tetratricopeptide repeat protein [Deltaproteobacteria bacterium]|nr:tetratricopeptide repeat protein [Deltaproteobacteria bacterium]
MTTTNNEHFTVSCSEVTSFWDDALSSETNDGTRDAVTRHLAECSDCREFVQFASSLSKLPVDITKRELDAGLSKVLKMENERQRLRRMRFSQWVAIAVAAALLFVIGSFMVTTSSADEKEISVFKCTTSQPNEVVDGVFLSFCNGDEPGVLIENGGDVTVSVRNGTVGFFIDPNRPDKHKVRVDAPHGKVHVKGTIFTVEVAPGNTWVEVFRGVVQIESVSTPSPMYVSADNGVELTTGNRFVVKAPKTEPLHRTLLELADAVEKESKRNGNQQNVAGINENSFPNVKDDSQLATDEAAGTEVPISEQTTRKPSRSGATSKESIYTLTKRAQGCLLNHDWSCAASNYRTVLKDYPNHPESMAVLISLAKIELRSLNSPKAALTHYQTYLKRDADGPLAEEAHYGIAQSYRRLGNTAKELISLIGFIKRYPNSSLLPHAQNRVAELER